MMNEKIDLTEINNDDHAHPFFGTELKAHKASFNGLITSHAEKTYPPCHTLFLNYKRKIIAGLNKEASLDFKTEGASIGMNGFPSDIECKELENDIKDLDELRTGLLNCMNR